MFSFSYDPSSPLTYDQQRAHYLRDRAYLNEVDARANQRTKLVLEQQRDYQKQIEQMSRAQQDVMRQSAAAIAGSIEDNFAMVAERIDMLGAHLSYQTIALGARLDILVNETRMGNMLLENIAELLRIPESQKQRQYHIEQGLKFFRNGIHDEDMFEHALENLEAALAIEKTDYFTLGCLGKLHLYSPQHVDLKRAEHYFAQAAKFSIPETRQDAATTKQALMDNHYSDVYLGTAESRIAQQAAEFCGYGAVCCFLQGRFTEALALCEQGLDIADLYELYYTKLYCAAALNDEFEISSCITYLTIGDRMYAARIATDPFLAWRPFIQEQLVRTTIIMRDHVSQDISDQFLNQGVNPTSTPNTYRILQNIQARLASNHFSEICAADDDLRLRKYEVKLSLLKIKGIKHREFDNNNERIFWHLPNSSPAASQGRSGNRRSGTSKVAVSYQEFSAAPGKPQSVHGDLRRICDEEIKAYAVNQRTIKQAAQSNREELNRRNQTYEEALVVYRKRLSKSLINGLIIVSAVALFTWTLWWRESWLLTGYLGIGLIPWAYTRLTAKPQEPNL